MWILQNESNPDCRYFLSPGTELVIGRMNAGDININNDVSVSRRHAIIKVANDLDVVKPKVTISDPKSTFGTYVGEAAIRHSGNTTATQEERQEGRLNQPRDVTEDVRFRTGLHSTIFRLTWSPFKVTSSSLKDKKALKGYLKALKGENMLINDWSPDLTHLVMEDIILTVKVVNALAAGVPIVRPIFFRDVLDCSKTKQPFPKEENYLPSFNETSIKGSDVCCKANPLRKTLFKGKTFIFGSKAQMDKFFVAINLAGGSAKVLKDEVVDVRDDHVIVIRPGDGSQHSEAFAKALKDLATHKLNSIPEQNIGIALVKVDLSMDCNPKKRPVIFRRTAGSQSQNSASHRILAPETQSMSQSSPLSTQCGSTRRIPATLTPKSQQSEVKIEVKTEDDGGFKRPLSPDSNLAIQRSQSAAKKARIENVATQMVTVNSEPMIGSEEVKIEPEDVTDLQVDEVESEGQKENVPKPEERTSKRGRVSESESEEDQVQEPVSTRSRPKRGRLSSQPASTSKPEPERLTVPETEKTKSSVHEKRVIPETQPEKTQSSSKTKVSQCAPTTEPVPEPERQIVPVPEKSTSSGHRKKVIPETQSEKTQPSSKTTVPETQSPKKRSQISQKVTRDEVVANVTSESAITPSVPSTSRSNITNRGHNNTTKSLDGFLSKSMIEAVENMTIKNEPVDPDVTRSFGERKVISLIKPSQVSTQQNNNSISGRPSQNFKRFNKQPLPGTRGGLSQSLSSNSVSQSRIVPTQSRPVIGVKRPETNRSILERSVENEEMADQPPSDPEPEFDYFSVRNERNSEPEAVKEEDEGGFWQF